MAIYRSLPSEPPTEALVEGLHARGVPVLVPVLLHGQGPGLVPCCCRTGPPARRSGAAPSPARPWWSPPPSPWTPPALRLGQGGGSYDRALRRRGAGAPVVAVVGDDELVPGPLPGEAHDVRVDAVVTPGRGLVRLPLAAAGPARPRAERAGRPVPGQLSERSGSSRSVSGSAARTAFSVEGHG